jgi:hypothetical protein
MASWLSAWAVAMKASSQPASASDAPAAKSAARDTRGKRDGAAARSGHDAPQKGHAASSVRTCRAQAAQGANVGGRTFMARG